MTDKEFNDLRQSLPTDTHVLLGQSDHPSPHDNMKTMFDMEQKQSELNPRLTVNISVVCEHPNGDAVGFTLGYSRQLLDDEQPYDREMKITQEWTLLSKQCWVDNPSLVVITNKQGINPDSAIPSERQIEEMSHMYLELAVLDVTDDTKPVPRDMHTQGPKTILPRETIFGRISPGASHEFEPVNFRKIAIRAHTGVVRARLFVVPS